MQATTNKYHELAHGYLISYYHAFADENFYFGCDFIHGVVTACDKIAKAQKLNEMDYNNAMLMASFTYAGISDFLGKDDIKYKLLHDFAAQVSYPAGQLQIVEKAIRNYINFLLPSNEMEKVAWDAVNTPLALNELIVQLSFLKEEMNRLNERQCTETEILSAFKEKFKKWKYYTAFAIEFYTANKEKNLIRLEKRIQKLELNQNKLKKEINKPAPNLSGKETEDLFKIAFRNYVHLVSVADSKAALLINVNSIIISVVIAFVVGRSDKYPFLLMPSFVLLSVAFLTICLGILASRPQSNKSMQDKYSSSYQTFFFGSFDLIGNNFLKASWEKYAAEIDGFLKSSKEVVSEEMYKETYNVRRVLSKKFSYLAVAYWVFLIGLFISIVAFFISTYNA